MYANLAGDLEAMAKNIVTVMDDAGAKKLIFISSIGIYDVPLRPVLKPYRKAADVIEASDLEYTILRPIWFTNTDEVDYEMTRKGEPEKGSGQKASPMAYRETSAAVMPCLRNLAVSLIGALPKKRL